MSAQSRYLAISRAVSGDDIWRERLRIACVLHNVQMEEDTLVLLTAECAEGITVDEHGTVSTAAVTDVQIDAAIAHLAVEDDASPDVPDPALTQEVA
ncbi:MAG: hypothetical protein Q3999_08470 [Buchananella hordeovulneris]|nr:hypothetical protein [Buchananella hordeovulneris]